MMPLCTTATGSGAVRMGVGKIGRAVGGPAGVADPGLACQRLVHQKVREVDELADRAAPVEPSVRTVAIPALSYPRYSRRLSASTRIGAASCWPRTPTIPHISLTPIVSGLLFLEHSNNLSGRSGLRFLSGARQRQRTVGHVAGDDRARSVIASSPTDRGHQHRVRADEGARRRFPCGAWTRRRNCR